MIFHKHQLIFIAIPKTATTSIWWMLRNRTDYWQGHQHYSMESLYKHHDKDLLDYYYSFTIVRNPYDRFVSAFKHMKYNNNLQGCETPLETLKWLLEKKSQSDTGNLEQHMVDDVWIPQNKWCSIHKVIVVDKVIKYETLQSEWDEFVKLQNERVPLSNLLIELPHQNQTLLPQETIILGDEEKKLIQKIYKQDFELFGYVM